MSNYDVVITSVQQEKIDLHQEVRISNFENLTLNPGEVYTFPNASYRFRFLYLTITKGGLIVADNTHANGSDSVETGSFRAKIKTSSRPSEFQLISLSNASSETFRALYHEGIIYLVLTIKPGYMHDVNLDDASISYIIKEMFGQDFVSNGNEIYIRQ